MNHRICLVVRPFCHVMIVAVLWKTGGVNLTEIRIFRKIWCRLADIVKTAPDKLTETVITVTVGRYNDVCIFSAPVCGTVAKGRALSVIVS